MDTQRIIALVVFVFSGTLLWEAWNKYNQPPIPVQSTIQTKNGVSTPSSGNASTAVPTPSVPQLATTNPPGALPPAASAAPTSKRITVETDSLLVELDTSGGDVRKVTLLNHLARGDATKPFHLMQDKQDAYFIAQSGLLGQDLPSHLAIWTTQQDKYKLESGDTLSITMTFNAASGYIIQKVFKFTRGSYVIDVMYTVKNESGAAISPSAMSQAGSTALTGTAPPRWPVTSGNPTAALTV